MTTLILRVDQILGLLYCCGKISPEGILYRKKGDCWRI
jgi:hypothetical protein